jgi:hypothetical protein
MYCHVEKALNLSTMAKKKPGDNESTTSSKSFKSLASKARSTLKTVKRNASAALSTVRQKKTKHVLKGDDSYASSSATADSNASGSATADPEVDLTRKRQPSVTEIDDDSDADSKSSISNGVEDSDDELRKQPELDI